MKQKTERLVIKDKKIKKLLKKGERAATLKEFTELLKRAAREKHS
jgi:hypothetical protein